LNEKEPSQPVTAAGQSGNIYFALCLLRLRFNLHHKKELNGKFLFHIDDI